MTEGERALQLITGFECLNCLDSGCAWGVLTWHHCPVCAFNPQLATQRRQLREFLTAADKVDETEFRCAQALIAATIQRPVRAFTLAQFLDLGNCWEREIKSLIHTLRNEWHLPIGSLRTPPYGYYWISTPEEFLAWFNPMKSQALNELKTAHGLMRRHYPELAGQFTFKFEEATDDPNGSERAQ